MKIQFYHQPGSLHDRCMILPVTMLKERRRKGQLALVDTTLMLMLRRMRFVTSLSDEKGCFTASAHYYYRVLLPSKHFFNTVFSKRKAFYLFERRTSNYIQWKRHNKEGDTISNIYVINICHVYHTNKYISASGLFQNKQLWHLLPSKSLFTV